MQEFNRQIIAIFDNSHVSSETHPSPRVLPSLPRLILRLGKTNKTSVR